MPNNTVTPTTAADVATTISSAELPSTISTTELAGTVASAAPDLSIWSLFLQADLVVQTVMLLLVAASVYSWSIIFDKYFRFKRLQARANDFEDTFWSGTTIDTLYDKIGDTPEDPFESVFASAMREWRTSNIKGSTAHHTTMHERIERIMSITLNREIDSLENKMGFLATMGPTAPFIGLFGTVWGIMHSFQSIAASKNTNLAVVAPGIAEALFATALGLIVAIPAYVAYNKLSQELNRYAGRLEAFSGEFSAIISRNLEQESA